MRKKHLLGRLAMVLGFALLLFTAFIFLAPTILTVSSSFFTQSELSSNYGMIFDGAGSGGSYIAEKTALKFIPEKVSFKQFATVLFFAVCGGGCQRD